MIQTVSGLLSLSSLFACFYELGFGALLPHSSRSSAVVVSAWFQVGPDRLVDAEAEESRTYFWRVAWHGRQDDIGRRKAALLACLPHLLFRLLAFIQVSHSFLSALFTSF